MGSLRDQREYASGGSFAIERWTTSYFDGIKTWLFTNKSLLVVVVLTNTTNTIRANLEIANSQGDNAVHMAAYSGHLPIIGLLSEAGVSDVSFQVAHLIPIFVFKMNGLISRRLEKGRAHEKYLAWLTLVKSYN
jgi:hypothetical protein